MFDIWDGYTSHGVLRKKYGISKEEFFYTYINTLFSIKAILFRIK